VQVAKNMVVERRAVCPSPRQPGGNGGVAMPKHPHGGRYIQAFGQRRQHVTDALGRRFEAVERGTAPCTEGRVTCLAPQRLDALASSVGAIAREARGPARR